MAREIIHKKLNTGTLVQIKRTGEIGIIVRAKVKWHLSKSPYSYSVYVRGKKVRECREELIILGET